MVAGVVVVAVVVVVVVVAVVVDRVAVADAVVVVVVDGDDGGDCVGLIYSLDWAKGWVAEDVVRCNVFVQAPVGRMPAVVELLRVD